MRAVRAGKRVAFVEVADAFGSVQVVCDVDAVKEVGRVREQDVVRVEGVVRPRRVKAGAAAASSATKPLVEIECRSLTVENAAQHPLPLDVSVLDAASKTPQQVELGMKHRYLSLRRADAQRNLRIRGAVALAMRSHLALKQGFLEVETPTLFKSTPEGAREFLVPARVRPNESPRFYALAQSPQQFKQMLMVGGVDRYFQIARCYRDEAGRADRQPEFTQLDVEMSFVDSPEHVQRVVEGVVAAAWRAAVEHMRNERGEDVDPDLERGLAHVERGELPRMDFERAMREYGSDKPDASFGMKLVVVEESGQGSFFAPGVKASELRSVVPVALEVHDAVVEGGSKGTAGGVRVSGRAASVAELEVLGTARLKCAEFLRSKGVPLPPGEFPRRHPFWVVKFPMFEVEDDAPGALKLKAAHHPFTAPLDAGEEAKLRAALGSENGIDRAALLGLKAASFDLVCDGTELGGGSIRIHDEKLQRLVLERVVGMSPEACEETFHHLFDALRVGAPRHGGFAIGFDRFVAMLCGAKSIASVLAFPKSTSDATDPMTGAPSPVASGVLRELGLAPVRRESP